MILRILYFASLKDLTGAAEETIEVSEGTDVAALWTVLTRRHPRLAEMTTRPLVACDMSYAAWERALGGVREVAFLPPVSGG